MYLTARLRLLQAAFILLCLSVPARGLAGGHSPAVDGIPVGTAAQWQAGAVFDLNGPWGFAWHRFLNPKAARLEPLGVRSVPGLWNHQAPIKPIFGYGTYVLQLRVPAGISPVYLALPDMPSAWRLYANGRPVAHNGVPARTANREQPGFKPQLATVAPADGRIELVLQVSNFHYKEGGIWFPIRMSGPAGLNQLWLWPHIEDAVVVTALGITGLYLLLVFAVRRREKAALWFGLFCLLVAGREGLVDQRILYDSGWITWRQLEQLEFLLLYLALPAFVRFFCALFPRTGQRWLIGSADLVGFGFALTICLFPVSRFAAWANYFQGAAVFICGLILVRLLPALRRRRPGARLFAFSFAILLATILNDLLLTHFVIKSRPMLPIGSMAFVGCQVLLLDRRYARSLRQVDRLSIELRDLNKRLEAAGHVDNELESFPSLSGSTDPSLGATLDSLGSEVRASQARLALLERLLSDLNQGRTAAFAQGPAIDEVTDQGTAPRQLLVNVLRRSLHLWERSTGKGKVELAEESGCWRVYVDGGTAKTRTLDKYLSDRTLPDKPRWRLVVRTVNHVLSHCTLPNAEVAALERQLELIEQQFSR